MRLATIRDRLARLEQRLEGVDLDFRLGCNECGGWLGWLRFPLPGTGGATINVPIPEAERCRCYERFQADLKSPPSEPPP